MDHTALLSAFQDAAITNMHAFPRYVIMFEDGNILDINEAKIAIVVERSEHYLLFCGKDLTPQCVPTDQLEYYGMLPVCEAD